MITTELKRLVINEASKLREHATPEELKQLNFDSLNPESMFLCVYGQMTGLCFSTRAQELISICAIPFTSDMDELLEPTESAFDINTSRDSFTSIEYYIYQKEAHNATLIKYLKGEIQELREEDL